MTINLTEPVVLLVTGTFRIVRTVDNDGELDFRVEHQSSDAMGGTSWTDAGAFNHKGHTLAPWIVGHLLTHLLVEG